MNSYPNFVHKNVLNDEQAMDVFSKYKLGMNQLEIAEAFGVCQSTINRILTGKTKHNLPEGIRENHSSRSGRLNANKKEKLLIALKYDMPMADVIKMFNITENMYYYWRRTL